MAIKYTPSQERAITTRNKSILVSAAAGSGKTAVLVQRIIEMVCCADGIDIDKLLVVTFTNAAAAEMKDKIYKEIMNRLSEEPKNKHLKKQLLLLSNAHIQTMHSFCLDVIKNNIHLLDIPIQFRIADETECAVLQQKCLTELIEECYETNREDFLTFSDTYGYGRDDSKIMELILKCYHFTISLSNPQSYYQSCISMAKKCQTDFCNSIYAKLIIQRLQELLSDHEKNYQFALEDINNRPDLLPYEELFQEELNFIKELQQVSDFSEIQFRSETFQFRSLASVKGIKRGTDNSFLKEIRQKFKDDFTKFVPVLGNSLESEKKDSETILAFIKTLTNLTKEFTVRFQQEKRKKSILDFSDFEHYALKILTDENGNPSETAMSYREIFHEILIDEYQDTNDIQDHLFRLISKEGKNLFLVGDVKQSIYGFRHAKPEIFINKQETYHDENHEVIFLSNNFRSRSEVVNAVNTVFLKIMTPQTGNTDYEKEALVQTAPYPSEDSKNYQAEILLIDKAQKFEFPEEETDDLNEEALLIAKRIHQMVNEDKLPIYDLKTQEYRDCNYGDIVILTRSMKDFSNTLYQTLIEYGIPVDADFAQDLFSAVEIKVLVSILKVIDNPYDELALLSLLKSPIMHWSEDEIFTVRNQFSEEPFITAISKNTSPKSQSVIAFLEKFRMIAYTKTISELLETLFSDYHWKALFCVYKNPEQRMENLDLFYQMARGFEESQISGLKGFLNYLEQCMKSPKNIPAFREMPDENAVRIITMHKSKGLEYPVVFLAGLGRRFHQEDSKLPVLFHKDYGIAADYIDQNHRFSYPTMAKKALLIALKTDSYMEEMRTLYVAMTRAKEKLILTATLSNAEKKLISWETAQQLSAFSKNSLYNAISFMDYLMPAVIGSPHFSTETYSLETLWNKTKAQPEISSQTDEFSSPAEYLFTPYHHQELTLLPTKVAVTEANRLSKEEQTVAGILLTDLDTLEKKYSQSEYGSYFHRVFELIDLLAINSGLSPAVAIRDTIKKIGEREFSEEIAQKLEAFFQTELAKQMLSADEVYREKSFLVRIEANKVYPVETDEIILLQGVTDCYFLWRDELILLDFKTDRNPKEELIRQNYSKQMELYAYALEKIEEKRVAHKYIYTAYNNQFIEF